MERLYQEYRSGQRTPSRVLDDITAFIDGVEDSLRAFINFGDRDRLKEDAARLDREFEKGVELSPLAGIPYALKDNICTDHMRTTCASQMLKDYIPPYSATVVERLQDQRALLVGKTNLDEFAMGSSTENSTFFTTGNPWNTRHVPGGSSGGSAAAVAAGQVPFALGSDTGGSIRQPAAYCGVVGMKPTYGLVSRYGLIPFASSLDQIGTFTRSITDCARVLNAICGHDPRDSTSLDRKLPDYTRCLEDVDICGMKIAFAREFFDEGLDTGVEESVREAIAEFESLGAATEEVSLSTLEYALPAYYLIAPAEASSNLARYDGVKYGLREEGRDLLDMYMKTRSEGFGPEVKRRIMLGTYALSSGYYDAYYLKAQKVRKLIIDEFDRLFKDYDLILGPTTPSPAFIQGELAGQPLRMYLTDMYTIPANMAGLPAMSIPVRPQDGMPVGLQIIGRRFSEEKILRAAQAYQQQTEFHLQFPDLSAS